VIAAWTTAEESGGAAQSREREDNHNWLNIGYFDSGPGTITKNEAFKNPDGAAAQTAKFLKGEWGGASSGIRGILGSIKGGAMSQIDAIANSGWASSGYEKGNSLRQLYEQYKGQTFAGAKKGVEGSITGGGGSIIPKLASEEQKPETPSVFDALSGLNQGLNQSNPAGQSEGAQIRQQNYELMAKMFDQKTPLSPQVHDETSKSVPLEAAPKDQGFLASILKEANHIADAKVPYLWGGGHAGKILPGGRVTPLDCSGAVSAALGINPRVASEFEGWGSAGQGKHVTIYAKSTHVIMEIDGRFWGTSESNPGGGAGWIKSGVISPEYLSGFVARHPAGL
jgi:hypothetical protein